MPLAELTSYERVSRYVGKNVRQKWIPLWGTAEDESEPAAGEVAGLREKRSWAPDDLVLMYSGNMGLGHRFSEFLEVSRSVPGNVRFAFFGGGGRRSEIEAFLAAHPGNVELHGYVAKAELPAHLRSADVHLVSLEPSWDGVMVPSKLQGIFCAGRPVIFVGSEASSSARWIRDSGAGWVVAPGDADGLRSAISEAADPGERARRGVLAKGYATSHFNAATNARAAALFLLGEAG